MAQTVEDLGHVVIYEGDGANDNDTVIETGDVSRFKGFKLMSTTGAVDVLVSLDGTNYSTSAHSLDDLTDELNTPVLVTVAGKVYEFLGHYRKIKILQNGATATDIDLLCYPK